MGIASVDWRQADHGAIAPLYAGEIDRWSGALGWDTAASWDHIDRGRRLGTVPGLLALDSNGAIVGWTFYLLHQGVLQVGGFVTGSEPATSALVDGILASESAQRAQSITVFVFTDAPGLASALARRGLGVGAYYYLMKPLANQNPTSGREQLLRNAQGIAAPSLARLTHHGAEPAVASALRGWRTRDSEAVADLLETAYPGADGLRPFAPQATRDEWKEYVGQLVGAAGCGTIMPEACYVVPDGLGRVSGVVLVTRLAPATAHIAQLAVDPRAQRRGLGRRLVDAGCASAAGAGCDRITLLVDGRNSVARQLYEASGFSLAARFVSAGSCQPLRLSSLARGGGASIPA